MALTPSLCFQDFRKYEEDFDPYSMVRDKSPPLGSNPRNGDGGLQCVQWWYVLSPVGPRYEVGHVRSPTDPRLVFGRKVSFKTAFWFDPQGWCVCALGPRKVITAVLSEHYAPGAVRFAGGHAPASPHDILRNNESGTCVATSVCGLYPCGPHEVWDPSVEDRWVWSWEGSPCPCTLWGPTLTLQADSKLPTLFPLVHPRADHREGCPAPAH